MKQEIMLIIMISRIPRIPNISVTPWSRCQQAPPLPGRVLVVHVLLPGDPPPPDPEPGDKGAGHQDTSDGVWLQLLVCKCSSDLQTLKTQGALLGAGDDTW